MTTASGLYREIVRKVLSELGDISEVHHRLVAAFAGSCLFADNMVAKHLNGEVINVNEYGSIIANQFRMAQDLLTLRQTNAAPVGHSCMEIYIVDPPNGTRVKVERDRFLASLPDRDRARSLPSPTVLDLDADAVEVEPHKPRGTVPRKKLKEPRRPIRPGETTGHEEDEDEPVLVPRRRGGRLSMEEAAARNCADWVDPRTGRVIPGSTPCTLDFAELERKRRKNLVPGVTSTRGTVTRTW